LECFKPWVIVIIKMDKLIEKYRQLILSYVSLEISADQFEKAYLMEFKNENGKIDGIIYEILNDLFVCVDAYCGNPEIANYNKKDPFRDISSDELMDAAKSSLVRLKEV